MPGRAREVGVRWTIGDVSARGFEALKLSLWGVHRLLGARAAMVVCVNTVSVEEAARRASPLPPGVRLERAAREHLPSLLHGRIDDGLAEGVAWKLAPLHRFPDRHELALDNDVILWSIPDALAAFLDGDDAGDDANGACLLAEDVRACFGRFAPLCGSAPRNTGIRGLPPGFDLATALGRVLDGTDAVLTSELDEQGLQVAALHQVGALRVVPVTDVTICSPFAPHTPGLGRCGAHFVGLNARRIPWQYEGRDATAVRAAHWDGHRAELYDRVGLRMPED